MKKTSKPGELFNKFQDKKKKHEKKRKSFAQPVNMANNINAIRPPNTSANINAVKSRTVSNNSRSMSLPGSINVGKFGGVGGGQGGYNKGLAGHQNVGSTEYKKKHSKKMKHEKKKGKKHEKKEKSFNTTTKKTGKFEGKSNALGHGGRAAQLKARGVPGGVIGEMARAAHAAPGQANYHGKKSKHAKHKKSDMKCKMCGK